MRRYLISYDISSVPRRNRAAARLEKLGARLQLSVYLVRCGEGVFKKLEQDLLNILGDGDSLLILPVCGQCFANALMTGDREPLILYK